MAGTDTGVRTGPPQANIFDSELTYYEKWLSFLQATPQWVWPLWVIDSSVPEPQSINEQKYISVYQIIRIRLNQKVSLATIFTELPKAMEDINRKSRYFLFHVHRAMGDALPITLDLLAEFYTTIKVENMFTREGLFQQLYQIWWKDEYDQLVKQDRNLKQILGYQIALDTTEPINFGGFIITKSALRCKAQIITATIGTDGQIKQGTKDFNPENYLSFFNSLSANIHVPFIRYNDGTNMLYKIYREPEYASQVKAQYSTIPVGASGQAGVIDFRLWADPRKFTQKSFINGQLDLKTGTLLVMGIPRDRIDIENVKLKIKSAFPISLSGDEQISISGRMELYGYQLQGLSINETTLLDLITNHPLFRNYLHLEEVSNSTGEKDKLNIMFTSTLDRISRNEENTIYNPSSVQASFLTEKAVQNRTILLNTGAAFTLPSGFDFVILRISKGRNITEIYRFINIFTRLLNIYLRYIPYVTRLYSGYISITDAKVTVKAKPGLKETKARLIRLKDVFKKYLFSGFARDCQSKNQPLVISNPEEFVKQTFPYRGTMVNRTILPYPAHNPVAYVGCDQPDYPFIGVKRIKYMKEYDPEVPYVPCCRKNPKISKPYRKYYLGENIDLGTTSGTIITTAKQLDPGRLGTVNPLIVKLFNLTYPDQKYDLYRWGMLKDANSAIHCLATALNPTYSTSLDNKKREMAQEYRNRMQTLNLGLVKQELYDNTEEEILDQLRKPGTVIDTKLYYRALEEIFNTNIYVFTVDPSDSASIVLEIPRNDRFHTRFNHNRPVVILYHHPSGSYELIVRNVLKADGTMAAEYSYSAEMRNRLYDLLTEIQPIYQINILPEFKVTDVISGYNPADFMQKVIYNRLNCFSTTHPTEFIGAFFKITGQFIDRMGKARSLELSTMVKDKLETLVLVLPPFQPLNYPSKPYRNYNLALNWVTMVMGTPYSYDIEDGQIQGLWYPALGLPEVVYVPVAPIPVSSITTSSSLLRGPNNPLHSGKEDVVKRYSQLRNIYDALLQLVIWVFKIVGQTEAITPADFMDRYTRIVGGGDSLTMYKLISSVRMADTLPKVDNINQAFVYVAKKIVGSAEPGSTVFNLYSEKHRAGYQYQLEQLVKNMSSLMVKIDDRTTVSAISILPKEIKTTLTVEDFSPIKYNTILIGVKNFEQWLILQGSFNINQFSYKINVESMLNEKPYPYMTPDGYAYMVQNVYLTEKHRALTLAYNWYRYRFNSGYMTEPLKDPIDRPDVPDRGADAEVPGSMGVYLGLTIPIKPKTYLEFPYVVYGVGMDSQIIAIEDQRDEDQDEYLEILSYGGERFAALLPIL